MAPTEATFSLGSAALTVGYGGGSSTFSGVISGTGSLTKTGVGTLVLGNSNNTYSGGTTLNGGTLSISANGNLGDPDSAVTFQDGVLQITDDVMQDLGSHTVSWSGGGFDIVESDHVFTVSQELSGGGGLTKTGLGTLVLGNSGNTYSGGTTLSGGTLSISADGDLGYPYSIITFQGGVLQITGDDMENLGNHPINWSGGGFDIVESDYEFTVGQLSGGGSLTKTGAGTLVLGAMNTYTGGTIICGGTLRAGVGSALPMGETSPCSTSPARC